MPKTPTTNENEPDPAAGSPDAAAAPRWVLPPKFSRRDGRADRGTDRASRATAAGQAERLGSSAADDPLGCDPAAGSDATRRLAPIIEPSALSAERQNGGPARVTSALPGAGWPNPPSWPSDSLAGLLWRSTLPRYQAIFRPASFPKNTIAITSWFCYDFWQS